MLGYFYSSGKMV